MISTKILLRVDICPRGKYFYTEHDYPENVQYRPHTKWTRFSMK